MLIFVDPSMIEIQRYCRYDFSTIKSNVIKATSNRILLRTANYSFNEIPQLFNIWDQFPLLASCLHILFVTNVGFTCQFQPCMNHIYPKHEPHLS